MQPMDDAFELPLDDWNGWALFLDIDGTLLDLAPSPDAVVVPPPLHGVLDGLRARLSGALALISGRELSSIRHLFPSVPAAAGSHGAQWRFADQAACAIGAWSHDFANGLAAAAAALPGVDVERKANSLSLHYRRNPDIEPALSRLATAAVSGSSLPLRLLLGKSVIEIIPDAAGKGRAIERFMERSPFRGRVPVFIGDDVTDEEGFATVNRLGGISIHVGDRPSSAARFRLNVPQAVRQWLERLNNLSAGD